MEEYAAMRELLILSMFVSIAVVISTDCRGDDLTNVTNVKVPAMTDKVPYEMLRILAQKRIFFAHQSVGLNILTGIDEIQGESKILKLTQSVDPSDYEDPIFGHTTIGENQNPKLKLTEFENIVSEKLSNRLNIAFIKFCYLDIDRYSDIKAVFDQYTATMARLKTKFPNIKFIHLTVPLTITDSSFRGLIKKIIGRQDNNINRNKYNAMLREHYRGTEPIFDIAEYESTKMDGNRETFSAGGRDYYALAPEFAADSGHLNEAGRRYVANKFLAFLSLQ